MKRTVLVYVLYDGIRNSVFESQVLQPLCKRIYTKEYSRIYLISFEYKPSYAQDTLKSFTIPPEIRIQICRKLPFVSMISLYYAAWHLRAIVHNLDTYTLIARGPLAGWLCTRLVSKVHLAVSYLVFWQRRIKKQPTVSLIVQARGLLAQEYVYVIQQKKYWYLTSLWHRWKIWNYTYIENYVYTFPNITVHAVSHALKEYIHTHFNTPIRHIHVTHYDIPTAMSFVFKKQWRTTIRTLLGIADTSHVYCYNGSAKTWQCPEEIISFFCKEYAHNKHAILLILTQDKKQFEQLIQSRMLNPLSYRIRTVPYVEIFHYLAACDTGIIFRKQHIINWVSRPTKLLEYQAANLTVVHNNTIACLTQ